MPGLGLGIGVTKAGRKARVYTANDIVSITDTGSTLGRVQTGAPHGLEVDAVIDISGNSVLAYNQVNVAVTAIISTTVFDIDLEYTADGYGGTWALSGG